MKKLLPLQFIIVFFLSAAVSANAQDSVKQAKPTKSPVPVAGYSYKKPGPIDPKHPPVNKLVQNVRKAYYRDKTDAEVAAIIYSNKATYDNTLDRIYNEYDGKKGISRATFNADIAKKYGDPFASAKPAQLPPIKTAQQPPASKTAAITPPVKPVADTAAPPVPTDKSLSSQYQYLLSKVYNYQQPIIAAFHKSYMDTLNTARRALRDAQAKVAIQDKLIDSLKAAAAAKDQSLAASDEKVNEVSLLGLAVSKSTYNLITWGLVVLFGVIAAVVIARSGAYSHEAKYRTQLYNELDEEYKAYKAKANEEKKLARELQTERNKLDDLLNNS